MRALCGAIITVGAMIGLGLTAVGIGTRYKYDAATDKDGNPMFVKLSQMDGPLVFILVFCVCVAVIGLGITFLGLAYHHFRREREYQWERERATGQRTTV
jgi:hypothetical protein